MTKKDRKHRLSDSAVIERIPVACSDELAAVEFLEGQRWGANPCCVHCGSFDVYKMVDAKTGERNSRYLWRCRDCKMQYTVRIGTVYEESRIELRDWCYTFWRAAISKKGVSALEIKRHCQISHKSALFLMNRIRFAMAPDPSVVSPLMGIVEVDETYVGGKPRYKGQNGRGRGTSKTPVFAAVQRNGPIHRCVVADVTGNTLKAAIRQVVDPGARIMSDENGAYSGIGKEFAGGHLKVCHNAREYARGEVHTNTVESSHALLKRSVVGIYHNVSSEYLYRYLWQADFLWNNRKMNDGERTMQVIKAAEGKRMMYRQPTTN